MKEKSSTTVLAKTVGNDISFDETEEVDPNENFISRLTYARRILNTVRENITIPTLLQHEISRSGRIHIKTLPLRIGEIVKVGRSADINFSFPHDNFMSRHHFCLQVDTDGHCYATTVDFVFHNGQETYANRS